MKDLHSILREDDGVKLSIFLTAGFPDMKTSQALMEVLADHPAVSFVELGMPFSDPLADGPTIQRASEIALAQGTKLDDVLALASRFRASCDKPLMLMGYCNPVYRRGVDTFAAQARDAGASGLILPDLPLASYASDFRGVLEANDLTMSFLVSPTSTVESIDEAFEHSSAFVYGVANVGLTGDAQSVDRKAFFEGLQDHRTRCPMVAGFGISDPNDIRQLTGSVDGAIIGSAFLRALGPMEESRPSTSEAVHRATQFLNSFIPPSSP